MSLRYDLLTDLQRGSVSSFNKTKFKCSKVYHSPDGYKMTHYGTWRLTYKHSFLFSESNDSFWPFVEMLDFRPYECPDTVDEFDSLAEPDYENLENNVNFLPSTMADYESPSGAGHKSLRRLLGFVA